jgi:hypothetical protein
LWPSNSVISDISIDGGYNLVDSSERECSPFPRAKAPELVRTGLIGGKVKPLVVTRRFSIGRTERERHFILIKYVVGVVAEVKVKTWFFDFGFSPDSIPRVPPKK